MDANGQVHFPATPILGKAPEGRLDGRQSRSRLLGEKNNSLAPAGNRNMPGWLKFNLMILEACGL